MYTVLLKRSVYDMLWIDNGTEDFKYVLFLETLVGINWLKGENILYLNEKCKL